MFELTQDLELKSMALTTTLSKPRRVGELLERLGRVPADRVRLDPAPGTATLGDVDYIRAQEGVLCELVDGVLVEKPMGYRESMVGSTVGRRLGNHVGELGLGFVTGSDGGMQLALGLMRMPDIAFLSNERRKLILDLLAAYPAIGPDLAIEILSESNTPGEMLRKRREYFAAGTRLVWEIDLQQRCAFVYTDPENATRVSEAEFLDADAVVSGFKIRVGDAFADLDKFEGRSAVG